MKKDIYVSVSNIFIYDLLLLLLTELLVNTMNKSNHTMQENNEADL